MVGREDFIRDGTDGEYVRDPAQRTGKILLEMGRVRNMLGCPCWRRRRFYWRRRDGRGNFLGPRAGDGEDFVGDETDGEYVQGPARGMGKILLEMGLTGNMCGGLH